MSGIYIAATGTDVGKTGLSLAGGLWALERGYTVAYYKPVQCGNTRFGKGILGGDSDWVSFFSGGKIPVFNTYFFEAAVSPHLAAELDDSEINPEFLRIDCEKLLKDFDVVIVEGAGGLAVPLNREGLTITEALQGLNLNYVLGCSPKLGTLNHSLLSLRYMEANDIFPTTFFMCQLEASAPEIIKDNIRVIESRGGVPFGGTVPYLKSFMNGIPLASDQIEKWLAPQSKGWEMLIK